MALNPNDNWKQKLTSAQFHVLREKGTEDPFSGALLREARTGVFKCAACSAALFDSAAKFDSNTGWPSFYEAKPGAVDFYSDNSLGMARTEVTCHNCGSHLGHVFSDAPGKPGGQRFCINSVALEFEEK